MKTHTKLLRRLSGFGVILAFRSLFQWEGPFTSFDGEDGIRTVDSDSLTNTREIYTAKTPVPLIVATQTGDNIDFRASRDLDNDAEFSAIVSAMGLSATQTPTGYNLCAKGTHDAEVLWDRILTLDAIAIAVRRLAQYEPDIQKVADSLCKLANLASRWDALRVADYSEGKETNPRELKALDKEFESFQSWGIKGLSGVTKEYTIGAPPFELHFADGYLYRFPVLTVDWAAEISVSAEAQKKKLCQGKYAVKPTVIPDEVRAVLDGLLIEGLDVRITQRLKPALYKKVNEMLVSIGGHWHTGRQAHVFEEDPLALLDELSTTGYVFTRKNYEFFATSESLSDDVVEEADIRPGMKVLEPNGGGGALALAAAAFAGQDNVTCYELMPQNVKTLQQLGFKLDGPTDFLSVTPRPEFDVCIMNPPFSGFRDTAHIKHATKFLKPGGRLVAIASTQWQTHTTAPAKEFQAFLKSMNAEVKQIPAGEFRDVGTDVATTLISFNVPTKTKSAERVAETVVAKKPVKLTEAMQPDLFAA